MKYLLFAIALGLSTVAEWYAIVGLMAIFASAPVPIAIMGALRGAAKLVIASWLYRNWKDIPKLMKVYFTASLLILMFLTSMGIFGFLSKAHLDQAVPSGDVVARLNIVEDKIKTAKENIEANRKALKQMDEAVDQSMARSQDEKGADKAVAIRRGQLKERQRLQAEIATEQTGIAKLNEEAAPIRSEVRKVEAEVGPIKYIAAVIYGDQIGDDILEKAVRFVTMMIVAVFDPLAVLLLIAANWQMKKESEPQAKETPVETDTNIGFIAQEVAEVVPEAVMQFDEPRPISDFPDLQDIIKKGLSDGSLTITGETEPKKDWEPELYARVQQEPVKEMGRYETELAAQQAKKKTQSFLDKVGSIEGEVEGLQK
jgi:hypothetical protein